MIFDIQHPSQKVHDAYKLAERILESIAFRELVAAQDKYAYTTDKPFDVSFKLLDSIKGFDSGRNKPIIVKEWHYRNSKVVATTFKDRPGEIYINSNGLEWRPKSDYVANGVHEFSHTPMGYGHGSNFPAGSWRGRLMGDKEDKNLAVPQTLERVAVKIAKERGWL